MSFAMKAARAQMGYAPMRRARGDPGWLGDVFGGIGRAVGTVARAGIGFVTGGVPGAVQALRPTGTALQTIGARSPTLLPAPPAMPGTGIQVAFPQLPVFGGGGGGIAIGTGFTGGGMGAGAAGVQVVTQDGKVCTLKGTHTNKTTYVTRGGGTSKWPQQIMVHPKHTECVKNRRQNPLNPHALSRAIHRIMSAKRASRMIGRITVRSACGTGCKSK